MTYKPIEARQFFILTFGLTIGTSILVTPAGLAHTAREDAWIGALVSVILNLLMVLLYIALARLYPGKTIFEIHEAVLGRWLGKAVTLLYLFYFLILVGTLLGNLGFFLTSEMMPETPIEAIQILFLATAVMSAYKGILILARVGELLFPWVVFFFLVLGLTLFPQIQWNHIKPLLEGGWMPVAKGGMDASMFQELIVLLTFFPLVENRTKAERAYFGGVLAGGLMTSIIVLLSVLVLGIEQTENSTFPAFALAKSINVGNFLQRVEGILITIWILTFFIKISLLFLSILKGTQTVAGLKKKHHLIFPLTALFLIIAWNTYINSVYVGAMIQKVWWKYSMLYLVFMPLVLYVTGWFRTRFKQAS
ncbi:endospore germination permease [Paenibacillus albidus]|uniref:GerAB/ArcD/ProY family transporter n=1 Tax=Paenibacillus albidus TaxID=2041023 RepID=UPI001BEB667B|nr:endospore germination permease [Paenibacillus albidus]MBT2289702.1 endospore germination permease [Paenibacillus albidus]